MRAHGKRRYVIRVGATIGIFLAVGWWAMMAVIFPSYRNVHSFLIALPFMLLTGLFIGWSGWSRQERQYHLPEQ